MDRERRESIAGQLLSAGLRLSNQPFLAAQARGKMLTRQSDSYRYCGQIQEWWVCPVDANHKAKPCVHRCKLPYCEDCARERAAKVVRKYSEAATAIVKNGHPDYRLKHIVLTTKYNLLRDGKPDLSGYSWRCHKRGWRAVNLLFDLYFELYREIAHFEIRKRPLQTRLAKLLFSRLMQQRKNRTDFWRHRWYEQNRKKLSAGEHWHNLGMGTLTGSEYGEGKNGNHLLHFHSLWFGPWLEHDILCELWEYLTGFKVIHVENVRKVQDGVEEIVKYATKITTLDDSLIPALACALKGIRRIRSRGVFYAVKLDEESHPVTCQTCRAEMVRMSEIEWQEALEKADAQNEDNRNSILFKGISTGGLDPPTGITPDSGINQADEPRRLPGLDALTKPFDYQ